MRKIVITFPPSGGYTIEAFGFTDSEGVCHGLEATEPFEKALGKVEKRTPKPEEARVDEHENLKV